MPKMPKLSKMPKINVFYLFLRHKGSTCSIFFYSMHSGLTLLISHSEFRPLCPLPVSIYTLRIATHKSQSTSFQSEIPNHISKIERPATRAP